MAIASGTISDSCTVSDNGPLLFMTGGRKWAAGRKDGLTDGRKSVRGGLVKSELSSGAVKVSLDV